MKRKTRLVCLFTVAILLLFSTPAAAASGSGQNDEDLSGFLAWADNLKLADPGESAKPANPPQSSAAAAALTEDELKAYADKVFELVNKERENAGVALLERNETLDEAAKIRAGEMVEQNSHTRPNGEKFYSVLDELGIQRKTSSENIYRGPSTPEEAVQGWMGSESHRVHILKEHFTATGIGIYQSQDGKLHWVQLFIQEK